MRRWISCWIDAF